MTDIAFDCQYNVIYGDWMLGYQNDSDVYKFLEKAKFSLNPFNNKSGMIIMKETIGDKEEHLEE